MGYHEVVTMVVTMVVTGGVEFWDLNHGVGTMGVAMAKRPWEEPVPFETLEVVSNVQTTPNHVGARRRDAQQGSRAHLACGKY